MSLDLHADRHTTNHATSPAASDDLLRQFGLFDTARLHFDLSVPALVAEAIRRDEGVLSSTGALVVRTGKYTGRSPQDKFVVDEPGLRERVWWGPVNRPFDPARFERLLARLMAYLQNRDLFVFDGYAGADPRFRLPIRVVNELAWQNLFARQLFIRPEQVRPDRVHAGKSHAGQTRPGPAGPGQAHPDPLLNGDGRSAAHGSHRPALPALPTLTIIAAPGFKAIPEVDGTRSEAFIILSLTRGLVIIGGTQYAGEMKKSVFTALNYLLPLVGVFPMHCSANLGPQGDTALFFGLSGTGKTTLSADPDRALIGDDEHGWSDDGVFNFEGGCYAKCIGLSQEAEPHIWSAIRFGSVLENVVIDPATGVADYTSDALTENTRAAYPIDCIPGAEPSGRGGHPKTVVLLTTDAFGVLPPIARLTPEQAVYHFLSGYTSKLAGTERGVTEPQATFSACFGAPFLVLAPGEYGRMFERRIREHGAQVYLVNTGWTGGPYGVGRRIPLKYTRAMVKAALEGRLAGVPTRRDPIFNLEVPVEIPGAGIPAELLDPRRTWSDPQAYEKKARELARLFAENIARLPGVPAEVAAAGPIAEA